MTKREMREIAGQLSLELGYRVIYEPGIEGAEVDISVLDVPIDFIIEVCNAVHEFERHRYDGVCRGRISVMAYTPEETAVNFPEALEDFVSFDDFEKPILPQSEGACIAHDDEYSAAKEFALAA